jgi:hypothetical protein
MITTELPEVDQKWWDTFVDEAEEAAATSPPSCGICIIPCLTAAFCASCYSSEVKMHVQTLATNNYDTGIKYGQKSRYKLG